MLHMVTSPRKKLGQWGEMIAASYLTCQGYQILQHNIRTPYGEIDLLACQAGALVFIEVKTRASPSLGMPEASITPRKFSHMLFSAQSYMLDHPELSQAWRIDVISVLRRAAGQPPEITHFENVTDAH